MPDAVGTKPFAYKTFILFCLVAATTLIGTPLFGYLYGYTVFDWVLFAILYMVTGLGVTVGYHRLISHRSFECHPWVKFLLLIAGDGRFKIPRCGGARIISGTMRGRIRRKIHTTPRKGFGTVTASGSSSIRLTGRKITSGSCGKIRW